MTEYELFKALRPLFPQREYALLPQVANGTGAGAFRHADAIALGLWPSRGMHVHGFEIKSYRSDWTRELKNPAKAEEIAAYCNYWWIVAGPGEIVRDGELPHGWGLMSWDTKDSCLVKKKPAPFREATPMDLPFVAALLRKAQEVETPDGVMQEATTKAFADGKAMSELAGQSNKRELEGLKKVMRDFKAASGIDISNTWADGNSIGQAVKQVLNGTGQRYQEKLIDTARKILKDFEAEDNKA